MDKRTPDYKAVILMFLAATVVTYWARTRPPIAPTRANLSSLPARLGEWTSAGRNSPPDKQVLEGWFVGPEDFLSRTYIGPEGDAIGLMVVYKGLDRRGWHLSEMCFSGSGYNIRQSTTRLPYAGRTISAVKLDAVDPLTDAREIVVYFFAQGEHAESSFLKQQISMALSRLRTPRHGWAFVRLTSPVTYSEAQTMKQIRRFLSVASVPLVRALTGAAPQVRIDPPTAARK
ncbi:MAG: exosortase C-terminal domain/associated protein EpsI [Armatimonadota bacterium]